MQLLIRLGRGARATAFFILILVLSNAAANKPARYLLIAAKPRVMKGRHFLSDAVCAVLFVALLAVLLAWLLLRHEKPADRGWPSLTVQ